MHELTDRVEMLLFVEAVTEQGLMQAADVRGWEAHELLDSQRILRRKLDALLHFQVFQDELAEDFVKIIKIRVCFLLQLFFKVVLDGAQFLATEDQCTHVAPDVELYES